MCRLRAVETLSEWEGVALEAWIISPSSSLRPPSTARPWFWVPLCDLLSPMEWGGGDVLILSLVLELFHKFPLVLLHLRHRHERASLLPPGGLARGALSPPAKPRLVQPHTCEWARLKEKSSLDRLTFADQWTHDPNTMLLKFHGCLLGSITVGTADGYRCHKYPHRLVMRN